MSIAQAVGSRKVPQARVIVLLAVLLAHMLLVLATQSGPEQQAGLPDLSERFIVLVRLPLPVRPSGLAVVEPPRRELHPEAPVPASAASPRASTLPLGTGTWQPGPPHAPRPLDFSVPERFLQPDEAPSSANWVFDRKLARKLDEAQCAARTRAVLAGRRRSRDGVSAADYARASALGEKIKTESGCFELREDRNTGGTRWWREACQDTRTDPWAQPPMDAP